MDFLKVYKRDKRKEIASDILIILIVVKFSLEYMFRQGDLAPLFGFAFFFAGILAVATRIGLFRNLLSGFAIFIFLFDVLSQSNPASQSLLIILILVGVGLYFFLKFFG